MKKHDQAKKCLVAVGMVFLAQSPAWASESVQWTGIVQEKNGYHLSKHEIAHELEFVKQDDGQEFDVVDSKDLLKAHVSSDKNLRVQVEGELTDRFLFWGGNLVVKNFQVLEEMETIAHREPKPESVRESARFMRGGDRR